jgi:hypothetical protein
MIRKTMFAVATVAAIGAAALIPTEASAGQFQYLQRPRSRVARPGPSPNSLHCLNRISTNSLQGLVAVWSESRRPASWSRARFRSPLSPGASDRTRHLGQVE